MKEAVVRNGTPPGVSSGVAPGEDEVEEEDVEKGYVMDHDEEEEEQDDNDYPPDHEEGGQADDLAYYEGEEEYHTSTYMVRHVDYGEEEPTYYEGKDIAYGDEHDYPEEYPPDDDHARQQVQYSGSTTHDDDVEAEEQLQVPAHEQQRNYPTSNYDGVSEQLQQEEQQETVYLTDYHKDADIDTENAYPASGQDQARQDEEYSVAKSYVEEQKEQEPYQEEEDEFPSYYEPQKPNHENGTAYYDDDYYEEEDRRQEQYTPPTQFIEEAGQDERNHLQAHTLVEAVASYGDNCEEGPEETAMKRSKNDDGILLSYHGGEMDRERARPSEFEVRRSGLTEPVRIVHSAMPTYLRPELHGKKDEELFYHPNQETSESPQNIAEGE